MQIDLHTHTIASGHAFGTIKENALAARKKGFSLLAITDHGPAMRGSANEIYFKCGDRLPRIIEGVKVLFSVEVNIVNDKGELDLSEKVLKKLDFVMAGFHKNCGYLDQGIEQNTTVLIKVIKNKYVKLIAHPYSTNFKVDIEKVTKAAIENNVLLELNASYFYKNKIQDKELWEDIKLMIKILKDNKQKVLINSDAHSPYEIARFSEVKEKFKDLNITDKDLLNNDVDKMINFLHITN